MNADSRASLDRESTLKHEFNAMQQVTRKRRGRGGEDVLVKEVVFTDCSMLCALDCCR